jgi:hypothetical protein
MKNLKMILIALCSFGAVANKSIAAEITGAGATFPYPIYAKWADEYKKETNVGMNYQSIGSGAGVKQIQAKTVTFGATDAPLTVDELKKSGSNSCGQGDSLKAIVGFFLSFGGKYFGGYAQQWEPKEGGKNYLQSFRHSLEKIVPMIQHEYVSFQCRSYEEWTPTIMGKQKCLIYCDPPYKGTEGYGATIPFEHERFWKTMREWSKKHIVIISEEHAPSDFQSIWSCKKKRKLSSNKQKRLVKREHLFIYGSVGKKYTKRRGEKYRKTIKRN